MYKHNNKPALNKIGPNQQMLAVLSNIVTSFISFFNCFFLPNNNSNIDNLSGRYMSSCIKKTKKQEEEIKTSTRENTHKQTKCKTGIQSFLHLFPFFSLLKFSVG
ncbi:hypothetical protein XENOCAPTIV_008581 [Xenoophorus captivus]|uniref:Uncharacterized protein n=1 Tax=Xenoophorus captivus TaxID=1517983 RepID=A0ABV0RZV1_9TELE